MKRVMFAGMILLLAMAGTARGDVDWKLVETGVDSTVIFLDLSFIDENHGWVVGNGSTIIKTEDGGETWVKQTCPAPYLAIENVQFINEQAGFCCGTGFFFYTRDGGATWIESDLGYLMRSTWDLSFVDENTGWLVVEVYTDENYGGLESHILRTDDGGVTWETQFTYDHSLRNIDFCDGMTGWAIGSTYMDTFDNTDVFRTTDGGLTWEQVGSLFGTRQKVYAVSKDEAWLLYSGLTITCDGGQNWIQRDETWSMKNGLLDAAIYDHCKALLWFNHYFVEDNNKNQSLQITENSGESWTSLFTIDRELFSGSEMYIVNKYVWVTGGTKILKITLPTVNVSEEKTTSPEPIALHQNVPNPFNSETTISYTLFKTDTITVTVFDVTGRKVTTLFQGQCPPGMHTIGWDGKNDEQKEVSSGVYFYEICNGNTRNAKRMMLLR